MKAIITKGFDIGLWEGGIKSQSDFPLVLLAALIRKRFLNVHSGKKVLTNIPDNIKKKKKPKSKKICVQGQA